MQIAYHEFYSTIDEAFLRRNKRWLFPRKQKWKLLILFVFTMLIAALYCWLGDYAFTVIFGFIGMVFIPFSYLRACKKVVQVNLARLRETTPAGSSDFVSVFEEDGLHIHNKTSGSHGVLKWATLDSAVITPVDVLIGTKAMQYHPLISGNAAAADTDALAAFLREKCPKMKILRKGK